MNKFALGLVTACLFTTNDGRKIVDNTSKVVVKTGNKMLKNKLGIDVKAILNDEEIEESEAEKNE